MASSSAAFGHVYDLESFGLQQMIGSSRVLRQLGEGSGSMEEAAGRVVDFFHDSFRVPGTGESAFVLVRCFKTHRFGELPPDLREAALGGLHGGLADEAMMCLALLATRGAQAAWNTRHGSRGHRAIPLATMAMLERAPMIARLVEQVGLLPAELLQGRVEEQKRALDVFHVEEAQGSAFVPAQAEFVMPMGVRSVLGLGGQLPNGELFFVLLFSRVRVVGTTASLFRTLALGVKLALLDHAYGRAFHE